MSQTPLESSKKNGFFRGMQRYRCLDCKHVFNNKRRDFTSYWAAKIWKDYIDHKQTIQELCERYSVSHPVIEQYLDSYQVTPVIDYPSSAIVVMDTTYFRRGLVVSQRLV